MGNSGDTENNELIKNDLIEQLDKYKRSRTSYLGKITQNIDKINNNKEMSCQSGKVFTQNKIRFPEDD